MKMIFPNEKEPRHASIPCRIQSGSIANVGFLCGGSHHNPCIHGMRPSHTVFQKKMENFHCPKLVKMFPILFFDKFNFKSCSNFLGCVCGVFQIVSST